MPVMEPEYIQTHFLDLLSRLNILHKKRYDTTQNNDQDQPPAVWPEKDMELLNPNQIYSKKELQDVLVGKQLSELPSPMAIIDKRLVEAHCEKMLSPSKALDVKFRPHIKTHKTLEGTALQIGSNPKSIPLVTSTISECEFLLPLLQPYLSTSPPTAVSILYSMPLPLSAVPRLARLSRSLGPDTLAVMIDHPDQVAHLHAMIKQSSHPAQVFIKVGASRAGISPTDSRLSTLIDAVLDAETQGACKLLGLYSHDSGSYAGSSAHDGMGYLASELQGLRTATDILWARPIATSVLGQRTLLLSAGATPDATSVQNLVLSPSEPGSGSPSTVADKLRDLLKPSSRAIIELHAGVYPFLDMQQIRTQAVPAPQVSGSGTALGPKDVAFTVLAEICSVYPSRTPPQALINAGTLALGREPCIGYSGMGTVSDWDAENGGKKELGRSGWVVGKVSQEHGILVPEQEAGVEGGKGVEEVDVDAWIVGRKVRVLPNHACIAGAGHPFYVAVEGGDVVVDVWVRCRGW